MDKNLLNEAREYESAHEKDIPPGMRPLFHLTPRVGWMNDPNGFCIYKGRYHMFYQYHPYVSQWDDMYWGHAVSDDLIHWTYLPAALAPDQEYDKDGCFSGCSVSLPDGRHLLIYTGVKNEKQPDGQLRYIQTQNIAVGDGENYVKYEGNPVITETDLPAGGSRHDFRDPKVWRRDDGTYIMAVGNRSADDSGQILLYKSENCFDWEYWRVLAANNNRYGKMWECPDFFELDGKWVLIVSPQDMLPEGFEYHNGDGTLCLIGTYDETTGEFREERDQAIDYGIDFYAPQTILTEDGRRVMIGWMQNWDACAIRKSKAPWAGQMSVPRELAVKDGRLYQTPIRELEALRHDPVIINDMRISGEKWIDGIEGRTVDMTLTIRPADPQNVYHKFTVRFARNDRFWTSLSFRPHERTLKVDRKFSGSRRAIVHQRRCLVNNAEGCLKLRIILDRFSVEAFINDGEQVMSSALYTDPEVTGISFYADGDAVIDIEKYSLY